MSLIVNPIHCFYAVLKQIQIEFTNIDESNYNGICILKRKMFHLFDIFVIGESPCTSSDNSPGILINIT
jgi:hypothetical protein